MKKQIRNLLVGSFLAFLAMGGVSVMETNRVQAAANEPYDYALAYREYTIENYSSFMTVKDPMGAVVETQNGAFTPLREGDYTIREGGTIKVLRVFANVPKTTYEYDFSYEAEYKTGEIISLPQAMLSSAIRDKIPYDIFVECEGTVVDVLSKNQQETYQFVKSGSYAMVYTYEDIFGYISTSANYFEVVDAPVIAYKAPETISFGKEVAIDTVYAYNGDEKVTATLEVVTPSSKTVDLSSGSFVADEFGTYTYIVTAQIGGQTLTAQYDVPCDTYTKDLFEAASLAKAPAPQTPLPEICLTQGNGLLLQAESDGAKYTFANVIDLNNITRGTNLLTFFPYVTNDIGYANDLQIIFTDIYNKDNSIGIQFKCSPFHDNLTYVSAFNGRRHYAFDNENWVLTGVNGPVKIGDEYFFAGIMRNHYSMQMKNPNGGLHLYSFTIDYPQRQMVLDLTTEGEGRYTLMDFDNPIWCGGSDYVWDGFTTGEVYMTIQFGTLTGGSASITVTEVAGQSVTGMTINDTVAPAITVDINKDYRKNMPYGLVGQAYDIPTAHANDVVSGVVDVDMKIFFDGEAVPYDGGDFIPAKSGKYTLQYSAQDRKGNLAEETFTFNVYDTQPAITVEAEKYTLPTTGYYFEIPNIIVKGMSGKTNITTEIVYNGEVVAPDEKGKIYIDKVGEIALNVTVTDWLGCEKKETLTIPVSAEEMRIAVEERYGTVPKGRTLVFTDATVYDFDGKGDNAVTQKIYVNDQLLNDNTYKVENSDQVLNVRYEVTCAGKSAEYTYQVTVFDGVESIFNTDGTFSIAGEYNDEVHFTFEKDGYFELVNAVSQNYLKLNFATPAYAFEYMDVYLTDASNSNVSVFARFTEYNRTHVRMQLNGKGDYYLLSGSLSAGIPFTFFYEADRLVFRQAVDEKVIFPLTECANGDVFKGFESQAVYVKVFVGGVKESSCIRLSSISNETFTTLLLTGKDSVQPVISTPIDKENVSGDYGVEYVVRPTKAYDVLQGAYDVLTTVVAPDGTVICTQQILNSEFKFTPNQYGTYTITYETFDPVFVQKTTKMVFLQIKDTVAPSITLKTELSLEAKLGDVMTVVGAVATDNYDTASSVRIFVYDPQYRNALVQEGDSYRFTYLGTYKIVYLAMDASGNQTRAIYYVEVK